MVEAPPKARTSTIDVIRCLIGGEAYGLEMAWVQGVERTDRLRPASGSGTAVGMLSDGGGTIPVYSLAGQLGRPVRTGDEAEGPAAHIVVLNGDPEPLGLLVDRVSPVQRVPLGSFLSLPALIAEPSARYFRGIIKLDSEMMLWLAPDRLVPGGRPRWSPRAANELDGPPAHRAPRPNRDLEARRGGQGQIVIFSTAEPTERKRPISFGLSINQVLEILDLPPVIPVPGAPEAIVGLVAWHDRALPVIDLDRRMGLPAQRSDARTRLLVARAHSLSEPIAFLVRPLVRVRRLPLPHLPCRQPPAIDASLIRGALELKDETLLIPDIAKVSEIHGSGR